ncbi:unnamed protein product [Phaedon cochleariae]|uniref:Anion exchange protein n=1 Tax=Phaedon cochleariae TaxID=80249 RepID=A0A9N9SE79_PHACE|nr:unnamed protein product [Phaedon cochleariae]
MKKSRKKSNTVAHVGDNSLAVGANFLITNDGNNDIGLDEECAKVFVMDNDYEGYNFHDPEYFSGQPKFGEKDYIRHRERDYPHMHAPLKIGFKSMKRRTIQPSTPVPAIVDSHWNDPEHPLLEKSPLTSLTNEDVEDIPDVSESENIISDPSNHLPHTHLEDTPTEKKVSFPDNHNHHTDSSDLNQDKRGIKKDHHDSHSKTRKHSLPDISSHRRRSHKDKENNTSLHGRRRISTQPEDKDLTPIDINQLDSHRSDDSRALRRHKASRTFSGNSPETNRPTKKCFDHSPHAIFVELAEIVSFENREDREWKETARWIKYEEDVEEGVDRWGKPHVASLSFHSLLNLRRCLEEGLVVLDMEETDLPAIAHRISEDLYKEDLIKEEDIPKIMRTLLLRHRHVNEQDRGFRFSNRKQSSASLQNLFEPDKRKRSYPIDNHTNHIKNGDPSQDALLKRPEKKVVIDIKDVPQATSNEDLKTGQHNETILKRIPAGAEGSVVLVGEVEFLDQPAIAFIRLAEGTVIPSLIEVNIPVRFVFVLLGPRLPNIDYHEVGRSISTLMANTQFHSIAYKADTRKELLSAINEFLDASVVLPPGDWAGQAVLPFAGIKAKIEAIRRRKENALKKEQEAHGIVTQPLISQGEDRKKDDDPLVRTNKPWGGLIRDLKRRYPHYKSDIVDGLNFQCVAAAIFMYFAAVSGAIAFGGLTGDKTESLIGISETLLCTSIGGIIFAVLGGQPLIIIGTTGALLLFDESLFQFCKSGGYDFLKTRIYISLWLAVIGVTVACFEGSVFVKLFTRFTEDIFSALIVLLYILESVVKVFYLYTKHPLMGDYCVANSTAGNSTAGNSTASNSTAGNRTVGDAVKRDDVEVPSNQPNTALFCTILTLGTFAIAYYLRMFRNSQFLGRSARRALGDFGVPIAIIIMVLADYNVPEIYTEKLNVPLGFSPSDTSKRKWFIPPDGVPVWIILIISKPERKLKKGSGLHLDIVIVCLINILCGFFGFPWLCAAAVRSIVHTSALTVMSRTHAPGEKPHLIEVKEQRLSALMVSILIGLSVLMSPLLRLVPMAVVLGIFLYMGVASTDGIQFFDRTRLFFMPVKHHPQTSYVRRVTTYKMHLFTLIQLICLVILWIVKSTKASLAFPFFLILMVPLRSQLPHFFSQRELRALDGDQVDGDDDEPDFYAEAPLPG